MLIIIFIESHTALIRFLQYVGATEFYCNRTLGYCLGLQISKVNSPGIHQSLNEEDGFHCQASSHGVEVHE
jgi:hypothetical protein